MLAQCPVMPGRIKRSPFSRVDAGILTIALAAWVAGLALILTHRIFVTNDSLSNYAHVWYVAKVFWHGGGIPYHFPEIGHGDALAFPYAFVPWLSAAFLRPVFGDWVVTLWLVLGGLGTLAATLWAFPELRRPLPAALLLVNPLMVEAVVLGQLPFLWAAAFWFVAAGFWRREHTVLAVGFAALAQGSHPAVVLPLAGLTVLAWLPFERHRLRLAVAYAVSVVLAGPGIAMTLLSPAVEDSTLYSLVANFLGTVSLRALVIFAPFLVLLAQRWFSRQQMLAFIAVVFALNFVLIPIRSSGYAWQAFMRAPDASLVPFLESPEFERGATYRLLRVGDGKLGMYQLIRHGGRLDSEFFPESIDRRSWPSLDDYTAFLARRHVDYVLIYHAYDQRYRTNEHALLDQLVARGCAHRHQPQPGFDLYRVQLTCQ